MVYHNLSRAIVLCLMMLSVSASSDAVTPAATCTPTRWDEIGPFYKPNAPVRPRIGWGYVLRGTVRSAADCRPLQNIRIEVWQAGPDGKYDDAHRATLYSDRNGRYRLETSYPPAYGRRPPHLHLLVDATGYEGLITQHYPAPGAKWATFDLVLTPEGDGPGLARDPLGR